MSDPIQKKPIDTNRLNDFREAIDTTLSEGYFPRYEENGFNGFTQNIGDDENKCFVNPEYPGFVYDPERGYIFDPVNGYIFDPERGQIFDPLTGKIFDPLTGQIFDQERGLIFDARALYGLPGTEDGGDLDISQGLYDSYGNKINILQNLDKFIRLIFYALEYRDGKFGPGSPCQEVYNNHTEE